LGIPIESRRRYQQAHRLLAGELPGLSDQLLADASSLVCTIDGKIGKVAAVREIGHCARDPGERHPLTRSHDEICIIDHSLDAIAIDNRPALIQPGPMQYIDKFVCRD
jgi:hypothetical protein